jgi:[NiFe] hydrogenase small subunit
MLKTPDLRWQKGKDSRGAVSRRDFLALSSAVAALLNLGPGGSRIVQAALASGLRPPVLWLHFSECTGCTEAILRTSKPYFDEIILGSISLDYHETVMVTSGESAERLRNEVLSKYAGEFLCVVEGAIPTADNGAWGTVGGKTMLAIAQDVLPKAKAIIAVGSCATNGGLPAAAPNPSGAKGVSAALPGLKVPVVNLPGCPFNPINLVGVIVNYLLKGTVPPLDSLGRPVFAHGSTVHSNCELKGTADCLLAKGCRGMASFHNCSKEKYNDGTNYCTRSGHVCVACAEASFWDADGVFWEPPFWREYAVPVDAKKNGITYAGDPKGLTGGAPNAPSGTATSAGTKTETGSGTATGTGTSKVTKSSSGCSVGAGSAAGLPALGLAAGAAAARLMRKRPENTNGNDSPST